MNGLLLHRDIDTSLVDVKLRKHIRELAHGIFYSTLETVISITINTDTYNLYDERMLMTRRNLENAFEVLIMEPI